MYSKLESSPYLYRCFSIPASRSGTPRYFCVRCDRVWGPWDRAQTLNSPFCGKKKISLEINKRHNECDTRKPIKVILKTISII